MVQIDGIRKVIAPLLSALSLTRRALALIQANLSGIQAFHKTYELGNFTEAAKALGLSPQAVSRSVGRLEEDLGVVLFRRNTRSLHATEHALHYYEGTRDALQALYGAERRLRPPEEQGGALQGSVRLSAPTTYGHRRLMPWLGAFGRLHPQIEIDLEVSQGREDLEALCASTDLVIRAGALKRASGLIAQRLGDFTLGVFASPSYLREHGEPDFPQELERHRCVTFMRPGSERVLPWVFSPQPEVWLPPSQIRVRQDALGLVSLACQGAGLIQAHHYLVERELERGELLEVLKPFGGCTRSFWLIHEPARGQRDEVRAMIEFIMERSLRDARS